ncbi:MAG: hypothetical protein RI996_33 [Candidatus Parcubacteria bacterium]
MKKAVLIYPNQLFEEHPLLSERSTVFLVEEPLLFTQYKFHKQKILFHRASMQAYRDMLLKQGHTIVYIESKDIQKTEDIALILQKHHITEISVCDVVDDWLYKKLTKSCSEHSIAYTIVDTPLFLTDRKSLDSFFLPLLSANKKLLMRTFYEWQRKRLHILMDGNKPIGNQWSFDSENRKKIPKGMELPEPPRPSTHPYIGDAREYVEMNFTNNYGTDESFFYPVTHLEAKEWLVDFLKYKLSEFGPYEDAMTTHSSFLFHSVLSPLLNTGLLTPAYVIQETMIYAEKNTVPLPSLEGFIRQIIGWREYIRAVYVYLGGKERTLNYFKATSTIPESFWTADTGIAPVDDIIKSTLKYAYAHHIPRLMVMGNFMNLCGFKPNEVYKWFMELYIDAYDWVMVPNVYSMALYADGGLITTKPYISGSNYIIKMSNYTKGVWVDIWDSLFWYFVETHFEKLSGEGRLGFIGITYLKMSEEKKSEHRLRAKKYLNTL